VAPEFPYLMRALRGVRAKVKRADALRDFVALGRSVHQNIAQRHDEYLYGKPVRSKTAPPKIRDRVT